MPIPVRPDWYYLGAWVVPVSKGPVSFYGQRIEGRNLSWLGLVMREGSNGMWHHVHRVMLWDLPSHHFIERRVGMEANATDVEAASHTAQVCGIMAYQLKQTAAFIYIGHFGRGANGILKTLNKYAVCLCDKCFAFQEHNIPRPSIN